jgi:putative ABC transport system permease protein
MDAASCKNGARNYQASVVGTNEHYAKMNNYEVASGRFLTKEDRLGSGALVVVLGHKVAQKLFGAFDPINQSVRIAFLSRGGPRGFRVVGVMKKSGNIGFRNVDSQVVLPVTTVMHRMLNLRYVTTISVKANSAELVEPCIGEIKRVLRRRHGLRIGENDDFQVFSQERQRREFMEIRRLFAIVFYSIAGISLVVGGIGIMNIMLVSVTERTREIGVRIAVGAQRGDILLQFLIEASVISLLGGGFGLLVGFGFSTILERMSQDILETYTPPKVIAWALAMAILTGIISGIYPAIKASRLDPVEALRYE